MDQTENHDKNNENIDAVKQRPESIDEIDPVQQVEGELLIDPITGLFTFVNNDDDSADANVPILNDMEFDALFKDDATISDNTDKKDAKKPGLQKRIWTIESLENLVKFISLDEKRIIQNQKLRLFQSAIENDLYVDIEFQKHESDMTTALNDVLVDKKAFVGYNGGLWPIMMVQARSATLKELSKKSKEATIQKEIFKSNVQKDNVTHANEMTQQMAKNWSDVQDERIRHMVALARIDKEARRKNFEAWLSFLREIDEGAGRDMLEGRTTAGQQKADEGNGR